MRRLKLFVAVSLDGYLARQDGSVDWLFTDQDYGMRAFFSSVDTVLIGRKTHDFMVAHGMPAYPGIKNCVFTSARNRDNYGGKVEYVGADPVGFVAALKQRRARTSGSAAAALLQSLSSPRAPSTMSSSPSIHESSERECLSSHPGCRSSHSLSRAIPSTRLDWSRCTMY